MPREQYEKILHEDSVRAVIREEIRENPSGAPSGGAAPANFGDKMSLNGYGISVPSDQYASGIVVPFDSIDDNPVLTGSMAHHPDGSGSDEYVEILLDGIYSITTTFFFAGGNTTGKESLTIYSPDEAPFLSVKTDPDTALSLSWTGFLPAGYKSKVNAGQSSGSTLTGCFGTATYVCLGTF